MNLENDLHNREPFELELTLADSPSKDVHSVWSEELFGQRKEQTLAGSILGSARDAICGPASNDDEKNRRSQSNDEAAHVIADVTAFIPGSGMLKAGLTRAVLLSNPQEGLSANEDMFGINLMQGAALNAAAKLTAPTGRLAELASARMGTGLPAEMTRHFIAGMGFSSVRTAFDQRTWIDDNGAFSLKHGAEKLAMGTAAGALINVPAGMLGYRVASAVSLGLSRGLASRLTAGAASGFAAGGVFGFSDAFASTGSLYQASQGFLSGGMLGAVTGGIVSGSDSSVRTAQPINLSSAKTIHIDAGERIDTATNTINTASVETAAPPEYKVIPGYDEAYYTTENKALWEGLKFKSVGEQTLTSLFSQLPPPQEGTYTHRYMAEGAPEKFESPEQFDKFLRTEERPALIYQLGANQIIVPKDYAPKLEDIRQLRLAAEHGMSQLPEAEGIALISDNSAHLEQVNAWLAQDTGFKTVDALNQYTVSQPDGISFEEVLKPSQFSRDIWKDEIVALKQRSPSELKQMLALTKASVDLKAHPLRRRVLPEELIPILSRTPNRASMPKIVLLDNQFIGDTRSRQFDPWVKSAIEKGQPFDSAATAFGNGYIEFYRPQDVDQIARDLRHEQVHLNHDALYAMARKMEERLEASEYGYRNDRESEAELESKAFLGNFLSPFLTAGEHAPVRMSVIARKLTESIEKTPLENRSLETQEILARARYVERYVTPKAVQRLADELRHQDKVGDALVLLKRLGGSTDPSVRRAFWQVLEHGNIEQARQAADLLAISGAPADIESLGAMALTNPGTDKGLAAFQAMVKAQYPNHTQAFDHFVKLATPGSESPFQAQAREALQQSQDPRAPIYRNLLHLLNPKHNFRIQDPARILNRLPDEESRRIWFGEFLKELDERSTPINRFMDGKPDPSKLLTPAQMKPLAVQKVVERMPELASMVN